ncbi:hypothetical protein [Spongiactinospora sp. TRM90649]|uniref:hypothetical protein n=1 Tax=Spongiactinospora sp. TRM90649 TaxID=3031114 RepID=UPI0023F90906|nr:hypothetical protein [Spongiactinospora sp. TRM90649]MDF5755770.1 hypothetical protein [Spongiactinospora sp. TRM90649]
MEVLAHGIGTRIDLPIPVFYAFAAALAALFVSFLGLAVLWREPRFRGAAAGRPVPFLERAADSRAVRGVLRAGGLAAAAMITWFLVAGPADPARNPAPWLVYIVFWVGLAPVSLVFGPVWRLVNPLRTVVPLVRAMWRRPPRPLPERLGLLPATAGLLAFTWMELVWPEPAATSTLMVFGAVYTVAHLAGVAVYGTAWLDRADAFEVYSALAGALSPLGRRSDGRLVLRGPFSGLSALPGERGLVATVCVLLGGTAYDGLSSAPAWADLLQSGSLGPTLTGTLGLLGTIGVVAGLYLVCAGRTTEFAHSLVPVAVGYLVAHYFSLLVIDGQRAVILALGVDAKPDDTVVTPATIATVQVIAIIVGHVLGVIAAHDRALRLFSAGQAVSRQIPLFLLMVGYTLGGLALLLVT